MITNLSPIAFSNAQNINNTRPKRQNITSKTINFGNSELKALKESGVFSHILTGSNSKLAAIKMALSKEGRAKIEFLKEFEKVVIEGQGSNDAQLEHIDRFQKEFLEPYYTGIQAGKIKLNEQNKIDLQKVTFALQNKALEITNKFTDILEKTISSNA